jgi:hypothetical protein
MTYQTTHAAIKAADYRFRLALVELWKDMHSLSNEQPSAISILRYMLLEYCHQIRHIFIGQDPYPDHIVPDIGSAYSQREGTKDTPTTRIMQRHFRASTGMDRVVTDMIRSNWLLLASGYLFFNCNYC